MPIPDDHTYEKQVKKTLIIAIAIVIVFMTVAIVALVYLGMLKPGEPTQAHFTGYRYTTIIRYHGAQGGNQTLTNHFNSSTWISTYIPGKTFTMAQPFYNNLSSGTTLATKVTCETPGFSFQSSNPVFPLSVPTSLDASASFNNILVRLTFTTPDTAYSGPLIYTAYFDYYPPG
jgi:hypothetical protein